jgi:hypothetical protein
MVFDRSLTTVKRRTPREPGDGRELVTPQSQIFYTLVTLGSFARDGRGVRRPSKASECEDYHSDAWPTRVSLALLV